MIAWENEKRETLSRIMEKYSSPYAPPHVGTVDRKEYGCSEVMEDFCQNSTIHGIKYLGDRKRNRPEKLFWLIAFVSCIFGCCRLIFHIYQRWERSPVIVSFAERSTPIWQIPFPAVTICMETKSQSDLFNYTEMYHKIRNIDHGLADNDFTQEQ